MAIVTIGVVGTIAGAVVGGGVSIYQGHKNREMQKEFLQQQEKVRAENMELMKLMFSQNQQRQSAVAGFLTQSGYGDIANMMMASGGQGQGQGQQVQFPGNFPGNRQ